MIEIHEYTEDWPKEFEILRSRIWPAVSHCSDRIEHVGSTSVQGLSAKPIIDLDIVISDKSDLPEAIKALATIGYTHRGDLGIEGRQAFSHDFTDIKHNLYVVEESCLAFKNHIIFRDHRRLHPNEASAYGKLKRLLAIESGGDLGVYGEGKSEFTLDILQKYSVSRKDLNAIRMANKNPIPNPVPKVRRSSNE